LDFEERMEMLGKLLLECWLDGNTQNMSMSRTTQLQALAATAFRIFNML